MNLLLLVSFIEAIIDPVVVEPTVDGDGFDAANREKSSTGSSANTHGEHALEQSLTVATTSNIFNNIIIIIINIIYLVTHDDLRIGSSVKVALTL